MKSLKHLITNLKLFIKITFELLLINIALSDKKLQILFYPKLLMKKIKKTLFIF